MAENKKSIVVYADWLELFESLTNDEAGKLIKHFFRYVNDLNPIADDRTTELLFLPIKASLKRDLEKWESVVESRSLSGRIGNLKRWNIDLYNDFINGIKTIDEAEIIANNRKQSQPDKKETVATKSVTKIAVSVSESVNDINNTLSNSTNLTFFDLFRKKYKGTKRGNETEFKEFQKKHKDWQDVLPTLEQVIDNQIKDAEIKKQRGDFVPEWKNLKTWLNQRCWEAELKYVGKIQSNENKSEISQQEKIEKAFKTHANIFPQ